MKKISIVIPVYNAEDYILRCLDSIKNQSYKNFEIILVNDRSSDNTLDVLNRYKLINNDLDVKIFTNEKNSGPSISRNLGIEMSTGEYLFFIDADDDLVDSTALESLINKTYDKPDIVMGGNNFFVDGKLTVSNYHTLKNKKETYINNEILNGFFSTEWASVVWNKLYDIQFVKKNHLRFAERLLHEDELWVFQASALAQKVNFVNKKTYNYYYSNKGSITANVGIKNLNDYKAILKEKLKFSEEYDLYDINNQTQNYVKNFAKRILLAKVALLDYKTFRSFYSDLKEDFKNYFPAKEEFSLNSLLAYYLYKMKFDKDFFLYGKFPKYINPLLKI
ncbi:glycosyltransferase family 2 protein [Epilithonimonas zeae]|uniref:Glycosyltransferase involved in cell wall bisynthesis n=1 Tax=Epilithonimonas zeae TaxID=1416779 RepID=A0A1N6ITF1_9FLAO|nr:glycosyltransferase family 2 protein [Epilithonimonas zeae]SIO35268.1 Glycosyltransferase involved in cell wall bisynthesis [Epilithonimonas zeae]